MAVQLDFDDADTRKARGAFFTPAAVADFLAAWAVRKPEDRILDPACGEASLLLAAGRRSRALGGRGKLRGLDVHEASVVTSRSVLREEGLSADIRVANFFDEVPLGTFDVVIGNPPYVRYQAFAGAERVKAQAAAVAQGVKLSGLANAWAAFLVHAVSFLRRGGRLAMVLPGALLWVNYAAPVRRFILERFGSIPWRSLQGERGRPPRRGHRSINQLAGASSGRVRRSETTP